MTTINAHRNNHKLTASESSEGEVGVKRARRIDSRPHHIQYYDFVLMLSGLRLVAPLVKTNHLEKSINFLCHQVVKSRC